MPDRRLTDEQRDRIVEFFSNSNLKNKEIAAEVGASERTVFSYRKRWMTTGRAVQPRQGRAPNSGNYKLFPVHQEALLELSMYKGDIYLDELRDFLTDKFGTNVSVSALSKWIHRVDWPEKKATHIASKRNEELRTAYKLNTRLFTPDMFVFADESGVDRETAARLTGWAPKGQKVMRRSFLEKGSCMVLPAVTIKGLLDYFIYPGNKMNSASFVFWIRHFVLPKMKRFPDENSILVLESFSPPELTALCDAAGIKVVCLPPYSPDFNPVELFFSDLDRHLRKKYEASEVEGLDEGALMLLMRQSIEKVNSQKDQFPSYFKRAGVGREDVAAFSMPMGRV